MKSERRKRTDRKRKAGICLFCCLAALETGRIDGVLYGIPYQCILFLNAYSKDFAGERTFWTLPELMEAVREAGRAT